MNKRKMVYFILCYQGIIKGKNTLSKFVLYLCTKFKIVLGTGTVLIKQEEGNLNYPMYL